VPTPGLSLVGFMDHQPAINYLRLSCVPTDTSDAALTAEWTQAQGKLGAPFSDAGRPDIQDISPPSQPYIHQLMQQVWVQQALAQYPGASFKVIEIDPLLAFQHHILVDHSEGHCDKLPLGAGINDLLPICLPLLPPNENLRISAQILSPQSGSFVIGADSLNVRITSHGLFQAENKVGIQFGVALPFVHVVRHNGRCYLLNGFHRALGARSHGAGRIPCLFREVATHEEAGIRQDGSTFHDIRPPSKQNLLAP
jgi:hypothetical protein